MSELTKEQKIILHARTKAVETKQEHVKFEKNELEKAKQKLLLEKKEAVKNESNINSSLNLKKYISEEELNDLLNKCGLENNSLEIEKNIINKLSLSSTEKDIDYSKVKRLINDKDLKSKVLEISDGFLLKNDYCGIGCAGTCFACTNCITCATKAFDSKPFQNESSSKK